MPQKKSRAAELERETLADGFWANKERAQKISRELGDLADTVKKWEGCGGDLKHLVEVADLFGELKEDDPVFRELARSLEKLEKQIAKESAEVYLLGIYDRNNAVVSIYAGAGGTDAQDWAEMLLRMYLKYCERVGFKTQVVAVTLGQEAGLKNAIMEARGKHAYGYLKKESGVHRLVRISPFSAQGLRHTSFSLVEVVPELEDVSGLDLRSQDLRVDTYRAGGPGGQYVNKTESAVRITHIPTGLVATSQAERSQGANKDKAMKLLCSKIRQRLDQEHKKTVDELKGEAVPIEWGHQIRSYVLNPYKMVKDHRSGYETTRAEEVLEGGLEGFVEAELKRGDKISN